MKPNVIPEVSWEREISNTKNDEMTLDEKLNKMISRSKQNKKIDQKETNDGSKESKEKMDYLSPLHSCPGIKLTRIELTEEEKKIYKQE